MARVTVEDCSKVIPSRFELVVLAANRARQIANGARITVAKKDDKNPVLALREISEQNLDIEKLREDVVAKHRKIQHQEILDQAEDHDISEISQEFATLNVNDSSSDDELLEDSAQDLEIEEEVLED